MSSYHWLCLCDNSGEILNKVVQCRACGGCVGNNCHLYNKEATQRQILKQVRISESQLTDVNATFSIGNKFYTNGPVLGIQAMSDRTVPGIPTRYVGRRGGYKGNSVKYSITSHKPGSIGPVGSGVDVKHGSYARYLGKLKTPPLAHVTEQKPPKYGNKTKNLSLINTKCPCPP